MFFRDSVFLLCRNPEKPSRILPAIYGHYIVNSLLNPIAAYYLIMLQHAVLCCVVQCCAIPCYAMPCYIVLYCVMVCYVVICYVSVMESCSDIVCSAMLC